MSTSQTHTQCTEMIDHLGKQEVSFVAVKDYINSSVPDLDTDCEIKWVKIEIVGCKTLHICSYYRPHLHDEESLNKLIESFNSIQYGLVVGGDFNFPGCAFLKKIPST